MSGIGWRLRRLSDEIGLRFLSRRRAGFAMAVATMVLALGVNSLAFSVAKTFLRTSFGLPDADRLFYVAPVRELPGRGKVDFAEAYPNYERLRESQKSFADVAVAAEIGVGWEQGGVVHPLRAARVTASFFTTMGVEPVAGRAILREEEGPGPAPVVVISHALWQGALAGDAAVLGRTMLIDGVAHTVIGVMPPAFAYPLPSDIWLPFDLQERLWTAVTGGRLLDVFGRLKEGVSRKAALAELGALSRRAVEANPDNRDYHYELRTVLSALLPGAARTVLMIQVGATVLVLLAILNLASLLIAWGFERNRELSVRLALGARCRRVTRMLMLQSLLVVGTGGVAGLALVGMVLPLLRGMDVGSPLDLYFANLRIDGVVVLWTGAAITLAGLAAGALPAWFARRENIADVLRSGGRMAGLSPAARRSQSLLVSAQASLSIVLVCATALIGLSFRNLARVQDGYTAESRLVAHLELPQARYGTQAQRSAFGERLMENLDRESAIASAGFTSTLPVGDVQWGGRFQVDLSDGSRSGDLLFHIRRVSPGYLETMGIALASGRYLNARDDAGHPQVAVVSQSLARRLWPGSDPIGKTLFRFASGTGRAFEIVGVVADVTDAGRAAPPGETVYLPWAQESVSRMSLVVRPTARADQALDALRRALRATDPAIAANDVASLEAVIRRSAALPRLQTILMLVFAAVALSLVALGSYGIMSQLVSTREREFALRMLFGEGRARVGSAVLLQIGRLIAVSALPGAAAIWLLHGLLQPFVFGVAPRSAAVIGWSCAIVILLCTAAALPPALRAARTDIRRAIDSV